MKEYVVEKGTLGILFKNDEKWKKGNEKLIECQYTSTFSEDECVISPHKQNLNDIVKSAYGILGYYGFKKGKYTLLVLVEEVTIIGPKGAYKEDIWDIANKQQGGEPIVRPIPPPKTKIRRKYNVQRKTNVNGKTQIRRDGEQKIQRTRRTTGKRDGSGETQT